MYRQQPRTICAGGGGCRKGCSAVLGPPCAGTSPQTPAGCPGCPQRWHRARGQRRSRQRSQGGCSGERRRSATAAMAGIITAGPCPYQSRLTARRARRCAQCFHTCACARPLLMACSAEAMRCRHCQRGSALLRFPLLSRPEHSSCVETWATMMPPSCSSCWWCRSSAAASSSAPLVCHSHACTAPLLLSGHHLGPALPSNAHLLPLHPTLPTQVWQPAGRPALPAKRSGSHHDRAAAAARLDGAGFGQAVSPGRSIFRSSSPLPPPSALLPPLCSSPLPLSLTLTRS